MAHENMPVYLGQVSLGERDFLNYNWQDLVKLCVQGQGLYVIAFSVCISSH